MTPNITTTLTVDEWIKVLLNPKLSSEKSLQILITVHRSPNHQSRAGIIGEQMGYTKSPHSTINMMVGRYSRKIHQHYGEQLLFNRRGNGTFQWWTLFFEGWWQQETQYFIWRLKPELCQALEQSGLLENE